MTHGVPQGSILGSLSFLLYVNDIREPISNNFCLYYDDSLTIIKEKNCGELEYKKESMQEIESCFLSNKLELNAEKTEEVICSLMGDFVFCIGFRFQVELVIAYFIHFHGVLTFWSGVGIGW